MRSRRDSEKVRSPKDLAEQFRKFKVLRAGVAAAELEASRGGAAIPKIAISKIVRY
jgi:hypothetical protein